MAASDHLTCRSGFWVLPGTIGPESCHYGFPHPPDRRLPEVATETAGAILWVGDGSTFGRFDRFARSGTGRTALKILSS